MRTGTTFSRPNRRSRSAVRTLLCLVLGSQAALAAVVDQGPTPLRDPEYARLESLVRDRRKTDRPVALFVGSSRVANGFDAARMGDDAEVYNFGLSGSGPFFQSLVLERLRRAGVQLDAIFLEVLLPFYNAAGPRSLDQSLLDGARLSGSEMLDLAAYGSRSRSGPLKRYAHARALPAYRHSAEVSAALGVSASYDTPEAMDDRGFRPKHVPQHQREELTGVAHECYDPFFGDFRIDERAFDRLRSTIHVAQAKGTRVTIVLMPEGSTFRSPEFRQAEPDRLRLLDRMREELGVRIIDARDWMPDDAFYDQHHLTPAGAADFTDRFRIELSRR